MKTPTVKPLKAVFMIFLTSFLLGEVALEFLSWLFYIFWWCIFIIVVKIWFLIKCILYIQNSKILSCVFICNNSKTLPSHLSLKKNPYPDLIDAKRDVYHPWKNFEKSSKKVILFRKNLDLLLLFSFLFLQNTMQIFFT